MKKIFGLLILSSVLVLTGCNSSGGDNDDNNQKTNYTISFNSNGGGTVANQTIEAGNTIAEPTEPSKDGYIFTGWYSDSALTNKVAFPYTVNANATFYAGWKEVREYYLEARDKTVGTNSNGFAYDSTLRVDVGYSALTQTIAGDYTGKSQYSKGATNSYYEKIMYTGALFDDHNTYEYLSNSNLTTIKQQNDLHVSSYKKEAVSADYKYDSSSFAKALFTYQKDDIKTVTKVEAGKYEIKSTAGFSSIASLILRNINNRFVEMVVGSLPETNSTYHNYVSFDANGYINTYSYSFTVDVKGVTLTLSYGLDFTSANAAQTITLPTFQNLAIEESAVAAKLSTINTNLSTFKDAANSAYSYTMKSGVNFAGKNEIDATVKGKSIRNIASNVTYFKDTFEIDTDLKNDDLYGKTNTNVADYSGGIAKIADGSVYHVVNPAFGFKKYTEYTSDTTNLEYYYFLDAAHLSSTYINCVETSTEDTNSTYYLGVSDEGQFTAYLLDLVNNSSFLDKTLAAQINPFGTFTTDSIVASTCEFSMVYTENTFTSMSMHLKGRFSTLFTGSRDFTEAADADYELNLDIATTTDTYTAPTDKKDIL